jgi:hypothetical protein
MDQLSMKRLSRIILFILLGLVGVCLAAVIISWVSNQSLPTQSPVVDRLSESEKARLSEAANLRLKLGDAVWPGWSKVNVPFVIYNEAYAFAVNLPDPAPGWTFVLGQKMGGSWEVVPGDTFEGQPYYRQRLSDPNVNPQNFIARVGDKWAATMQTSEYAEIAFYQGFREQLPSGISDVAPYRIIWSVRGGDMDGLVAGLEHESFHVLQADQDLTHLIDSERISRLEDTYPYDDAALNRLWQKEMDLLVQAIRVPSDADARRHANEWLAARQSRRSGMSATLIDYERQREWLEGLAKYAELSISKAGADSGYVPVGEILSINNFHRYIDRPHFWDLQLDEVKRADPYPSEVRFYFSGFAQAVLLDRLRPDWKQSALQGNASLEDLLKD